MTPHEPIAVTGVGAVAGFGVGVDRLWQRIADGATAVRPITLFDTERHRTTLAAAVPDDELPPLPRWLSRADRFAVTAAREATRGIPPARLANDRTGVFFGSSTGALLEGERFFFALCDGDRADVRALGSQQNNGPGDAVARDLGVGGPTCTWTTACTSGNVALAAALDALRDGEIDVAIAGGADGLCEVTYAGFNALRAVDAQVSRPFRKDRAGLSMGEGAGVLVLEPLAAARARGAPILALLVGAGRSCDAHHVSAPDPQGAGAAAAIRTALADAGLAPDDVGFVNAHGTGTPLNDDAEAAAMRAVFGARAATLPITSTKAAVGHLLGAAGGLEAVLTVLSLVHRAVPATYGPEPIDAGLGLAVVHGTPHALPDDTVGLSTNLAFGGNNCAVLFRSAPR